MRIVKGLRAQTWARTLRCKSRSLKADKAAQCKSPFFKALGGLCTSCYLAGNCGQQETELRQRKRAKLAFERDARHSGVMNDKLAASDPRGKKPWNMISFHNG